MDVVDHGLFHLVQLTVENQEGTCISAGLTHRSEDGRGSLNSTCKGPSNSSHVPLGSLSMGRSWNMEVCFHFVPSNRVSNLQKIQTEGYLLIFQKYFFFFFCNGVCKVILQWMNHFFFFLNKCNSNDGKFTSSQGSFSLCWNL